MAGGLRRLAMTLSQLPSHPQTSARLEQYATEGDFAARWIAAIIEAGDLNESTRVVDLGAGNGILGIGLVLAGAASATLFEIDEEAAQAAQLGIEKLGLSDRVTVIRSDLSLISQLPAEIGCDLIITNPPWGYQTKGADRPFLNLALSSTAHTVHLLHAGEATHPSAMARDAGWQSEVLLKGQFRLPARHTHQTSEMKETAVKCWRFFR